MALRILAQMDPIGSVDIHADSTFRLLLEARDRGHRLYVSHPDDLAAAPEGSSTLARPVEVRAVEGDHCTLGAAARMRLDAFDVILLRQDPPFDMHYVTTTHILESVGGRTRVVNDPFWVRNAPEKILVLRFADLMPPTLLTRSGEEIVRFRERHGDIVLKPLYGNGGEGVFRIRPGDSNFNPLVETLLATRREALVVQAFIPDVLCAGDRRLLLVAGELVGGFLRVPATGEARSNLHVGGRAERWALTDRDREIAARVGPVLRANGLVLAGLDVIGPYLTEINVTSPTGLQELERLEGVNAAAAFWDAVEAPGPPGGTTPARAP